jgi:hypothetical protein
LAGDSTITSDLFIAILDSSFTLSCPASLTGAVPFCCVREPENLARTARRFPCPGKSPAKVAPYHGTPLRFHSQVVFFFSSRLISCGFSAILCWFHSHDSVYKQHFELRLNRQRGKNDEWQEESASKTWRKRPAKAPLLALDD